MIVPDFPDLPNSPSTDAQMALNDVFVAVAETNRLLDTYGIITPEDYLVSSWRTSDLPKKLKKWLDRLREVVKAIAKALNALSFTVTVGTSVSVSITFSPDAI